MGKAEAAAGAVIVISGQSRSPIRSQATARAPYPFSINQSGHQFFLFRLFLFRLFFVQNSPPRWPLTHASVRYHRTLFCLPDAGGSEGPRIGAVLADPRPPLCESPAS